MPERSGSFREKRWAVRGALARKGGQDLEKVDRTWPKRKKIKSSTGTP